MIPKDTEAMLYRHKTLWLGHFLFQALCALSMFILEASWFQIPIFDILELPQKTSMHGLFSNRKKIWAYQWWSFEVMAALKSSSPCFPNCRCFFLFVCLFWWGGGKKNTRDVVLLKISNCDSPESFRRQVPIIQSNMNGSLLLSKVKNTVFLEFSYSPLSWLFQSVCCSQLFSQPH